MSYVEILENFCNTVDGAFYDVIKPVLIFGDEIEKHR